MLDYLSYPLFTSSAAEHFGAEPLWLPSTTNASTMTTPTSTRSLSHSSNASSSASSSSSSTHEAQTPPQSPSPLNTKLHAPSLSLNGRQSWADEVAQHRETILERKLPSAMQPSTVKLPLPTPPVLSETQPRAITVKSRKTALSNSERQMSSASAPVEPSREWEEARRGRSRWPRVLWRSDVDSEALDLLDAFHDRAVGGPLPVLQPRSAPRAVKQWSDSMERAGL
ncbi:hypothetical protein OIO90_001062 [Microbotryomycetes sp. JL221]|nr:hypothetical protein OIO90_001062 [Microbotryomycetes sp. JL221]